MKPLILYVTVDAARGKARAKMLATRYNVTMCGPEEGLFHLLSAQFAAVVLCSSIPKRKLMPLGDYLRRTVPETPVVYLRTGRERHRVQWGTMVPENDERELMRALDLSTQHRAMAAEMARLARRGRSPVPHAVSSLEVPAKARSAGQE